jgi:sarcosine oxidase subunit alpha
MMSTKKDFIGRVLATRPGLNEPGRPVLVGLKPVDPHARLAAGAHFLTLGDAVTLEHGQGFMSSVAFSPTQKSWIGLGFLRNGAARLGERVRAYDPVRNGDLEVEVVSPVFYDRDGARLKG